MKALVIGGTNGFGKSVKENLQKSGYNVISVGRSGRNSKDNYICDVGNLKRWSKCLDRLKKDHSKLDLIVCIVGFARAKAFNTLDENDWKEHLAKNLIYVALTLKKLNAQKIITIGSQWSYKIGSNELVPYVISKHALSILTQDMAIRNSNLIINHYCVPTMDTPQYSEVRKSFNKIRKQEIVKKFNTGILSNTKTIARELVKLLLRTKESGKVFILNKNGKITQEEKELKAPKGAKEKNNNLSK